MKIRCPICSTEAEVADDFELRPFCSSRCKKVDLGNWLDGNYRLPRELLPEDLVDLSQEQQDALVGHAMGERLKKSMN